MNRLNVERLEDRRTPAAFTWIGDGNPATTGFLPYYTGAYWAGGHAPNNNGGVDTITVQAGADDIFLAGDFGGITTAAGDQVNFLVKDGNTLKVRDLDAGRTTGGTRTTFVMESNTTISLAGPIAARGGVVFDNSGGLAGNTSLLIDNAGSAMPTIGLNDDDGLLVNGVATTVTAGSNLMLWGNNGGGANRGYITFINPTTNPAVFTNNGGLYLTRRAAVSFASDFVNYGELALQGSSSIVSHVHNSTTGVIDIPAESVAKIGWVGSANQDLDNYGLVKIDADGNLGSATLLLVGNRGTNQRGDYNDYGETRVYTTTAPTPTIATIEANDALLSGNVVTFSGTAGRGTLDFNLTGGLGVYGTTFNHTYDALLFDQADVVISNVDVTLFSDPTFNVAGGLLQTPNRYPLLISPAILSGAAQPGTIPANSTLKQNAASVYLVRGAVVMGRLFLDGMEDSQNPANNIDRNNLDDNPSVGAANKTVWLYSTSNLYYPAYTTTTDAYGNYAFENVAEDEYLVVFSYGQWYDVYSVYDNYDMAAPFVTTGDSDVDASGTALVTLGEGDEVVVDAGIYAVRL